MTFEEYFSSASDKERLEVMKFLAYCGDPNEVLTEIAHIPPCVQHKVIDVRINHKYLFYHRNKSFLRSTESAAIPIKDIQYCYYSYEGGNCNRIGLLGYDGRNAELPTLGNEDVFIIFRKLRSYVMGIEDVKPYSATDTAPEITVQERWGGVYLLKNNAIHYQKRNLFGKLKENILVPDLKDLVWCVQRYDCDDGVTTYTLELHFLNSKDPRFLRFDSGKIAFLFAMELKKRLPHLLYGFNPEYARIYQQNPFALLQIAKNQAHPNAPQ